MSAVSVLTVFSFFLTFIVQEARAQTGQLCVVLMDSNVDEGAGAVMFQIIRKGGSSGSVTVGYTITDITTEPEDLVGPRNGTLTLDDGVSSGIISIPIFDDTLEEDSEQFTVSLNGQTGPETLATAVIFDNDIYSTWTTWEVGGVCSVTCGDGMSTDTRTRTCIAVIPIRCVLPFNETRSIACNPGPCPVISQWTEWTDGGTCSTTCGPGVLGQSRTRNCTGLCSPDLTTDETRTVSCELCTCPVISQWTEWADDAMCSVTCGPGTKTQSRTRTCTESTCCPADLSVRETRTVSCELCTCPVISQWTEWADDGMCSTTCGPGTKTQSRTRTCTESTCCPADLSVRETRTVSCELCTCPVISQWTEWSDDGMCSTTCGPGTRMQARTRTCTNSTCCPADLSLRETRTVSCELCTCPVISQWTEWADDGMCSSTCGPGIKTQARTRTCTNSTCCPENISLRETRLVSCELCACPVISQWTEWADDGMCSSTCGPGIKTQARTRTCTNSTCCPENISLRETRLVSCELCACPVISQWTEWADDGMCSSTCGPGIKTQARTRTCTNSTCCPENISLRETRLVSCELCACPVISQWTEWSDDGMCSTTCGHGTKTQARTRTCTQSDCCPADLSLRETRTVSCELCRCPLIGPWSYWTSIGQCSKTCGGGTKKQFRTRVCVNTCTPSDCVKREERTVNCRKNPCPPRGSVWNRFIVRHGYHFGTRVSRNRQSSGHHPWGFRSRWFG